MVRIPSFHCRGLGSIPGQGTEIPQAAQRSQKKKKILMYKEWLFMEFSYLSHFVVGGGGHDEFLVGKGHSLSCGLDFSGSWWEVLLEDSTGRGT